MFEQATRKKYRFETNKGLVTVEDLWDIPLSSKTSFDLDNIAKNINRQLKANEEESFVNTGSNKIVSELTAKLDIVKHVIAVIQKENQDKLASAGRKAERARLLEILEAKDTEAMKGMSREEILARINQLDAV